MMNSMIVKLLSLSRHHRVTKIEWWPHKPLADTKTTRQVTMRFDDGGCETMQVPGSKFEQEFHELDGYLKAAGWPESGEGPKPST